ncbi:universal stress protein [Aeoliella sp. ICT_H6.2]|uniref:Universal stress protein n=1 Tax=Aeoliella straminimaris TaxID=2954799 RepID=A0A9X2FI06_9BACT|nr:universal stress protein [Aeoliella straminimaris]MCO6045436.1 universal stress protein [Aeoliella straminimaris]
MNLHSVLCPTDFSPYSDAALRYASLLASESGAKLYLLHVVDESAAYCTEYTGMGYMSDMTQRLEHECQELLEQVSPTVPGVPFERQNLLGTPARTIIDFADQLQVDLIVIGSHGRTGVSRMLMGSVAEAVVRGAKCPVLTVKHPPVVSDEEQIPKGITIGAGQPT